MTGVSQAFIEDRIDAMFILDSAGRLLQVNDPETKQITPRLYVMRTATIVVGYIRHDVPESIAAQLQHWIARESTSSDFDAPLQYHQQYLDLLTPHAPVTALISGPAYRLPVLTSSPQATLIEKDQLHRLPKKFSVSATEFDFRQPILAVLDEGVGVSVCFSARKTDAVAEAGLFTAETHRKRGYGVAVVRSWAHALQQMGIRPLYSTSWDNHASQGVARKLKASLYAAEFSYR